MRRKCSLGLTCGKRKQRHAAVEILAFHATQRHAADDELREQQVDDDDGQDRDGDHHVNFAHIELQEVRAAQLCDQDGQGLFVGGVQNQSGDEVVVPAGHEGEDGLNGQRRLMMGSTILLKV